ncbi:hypothetical protein BH09PSE2_BH09PSE2_21830 [soil metagenome]
MRSPWPSRSRLTPLAAAVAITVVLTGAGAAQAQTMAVTPAQAVAAASHGQTSDPFERLNRKTYAFNQVLDRAVIRPLAVFWHRAAPKPLRQGVNNFLSNLGEPLVFINDVLQGRPVAAGGTAVRFVANSTVGLLGVVDVAGSTGLPHHDNGFGLTLGRWGAKSGPYLYLPVLGPSSARDLTGTLVDTGLNPLTYSRNTGSGGLTTGLGVVGGLDARARADGDLKALDGMATDGYAALRSFYLQNRESEINGGRLDLNALPDFDDPEAAKAPPGAPAPVPAKPEALETPADPAAAPATSPSAPSPAPPKGV